MVYKVTNIKYDLVDVFGEVDESTLPTSLVVECDSEKEIADAISDETGWLVESFTIDYD